MGSKRLAEIQTAIQRLTDARQTGLAEEIAAAQSLFSIPLSPDLTPQQILEAGKARLDQFGQIVKDQENIANLTKEVMEGINITATNLERPDRLGIPAELIDSEIESVLGIVAQATKLFIDPETGTVIAGRQAGELKSGQQLNLAKLIAEEDGPISQGNLAVRIFGRKGQEKSGDIRSLVAKLNRGAEGQGLPPVVINPGRRGYGLGPEYEILGVRLAESTIPSVPVKTPVQAGRPESYSISQVLAMEGIAGVLSETQTRRLTQELLAQGNLRIGAEVMEGRAQTRGASSRVVRDLELTPAGVEILRDIANQFGAQSRIRTYDVTKWLERQDEQSVKPVSQQIDSGVKRYWISQVAEQSGVPETAIKVLHQIGAFREGIHFEQKRRAKVYTDEALRVARRVADQAKKEKQDRFTERLIREAVGFPKENDGENPYGPNGPKTFTVLHEQVILNRLQSCIPVIEHRIGKPLQESFKLELVTRLGELTTRLSEDSTLTISPEEQGIIRRQAAATVLELAKDARPFDFLRGKHLGIEIGLTFIRGLKDQGQTKMVTEFAHAIVNPPKKVAGTIEKNGVVNGIRTVGPMGDE